MHMCVRDLGSEVKGSAVEDKSSIYSCITTSDQSIGFDNAIAICFGKAAGTNPGGWVFMMHSIIKFLIINKFIAKVPYIEHLTMRLIYPT